MRRLSIGRPILAGLGLVLAHLVPSPASATCRIDTSELAFGTVDIARGGDSAGEIALDCTIATGFEIAILGNGVPGERFMSGPGGARLAYDLYPDATRSVPWSDGNGSGAVVAGSSDGETIRRFAVYGRVPIQRAVPAGAYAASLTVVVGF